MFFLLTFLIVTSLTFLAILLTSKIIVGHKIYEQIGQQVVKIWEYFKLFERGAYIDDNTILDEKAKSYGKGKGYLRNLCILWVMTIMTDTILIVIWVIK